VTTSLNTGWNSIGWFNSTLTDPESLAQNITNCTAIAYWNNTLGRFVVHPKGTSNVTFAIERSIAYFVFVTSDEVWINQ
jgi:hypothetical protein